ncbi:MAG TPA: Gfo/Idh/MocA family oxidoreductase, partial [Draconibacterium sp.]|nr:Gfo/Idh/MocA family oxidoreductase [Draconibacterium sp.]
MKKLKGAVVGCGMISEFHLKGWERIPEVEIVALVSRNKINAEGKRIFAPNAKIYTDYKELFKKEILDFVDILTPPMVHKEYILEAKKHHIHIICQKPICDNIEDAREVVQKMKDYGKLFSIHENHRYRPWFQVVKNKMDEGFFGTPKFIRAYQHNPSEPGVFYKQKMNPGVLLEHGTHLVDMIHALSGSPIQVYCSLRHVSNNLIGESLAHVVYEYDNATAIVDVAWKPGGTLQAGFILEGTEGEACFSGSLVRGGKSRFILTKGKKIVLDEMRNSTVDYEEAFYLFERECTDRMLDGKIKDITQSGMENLKSLESTFAAYHSAYSNSIRIINHH